MFDRDNRGGGNIELTEAMRDRHFENEDWQLRKGGGRYWASIAITPLYNDRGVHRGFAMVTRDLTERQRIDVLMRSEEHTSELQSLMRISYAVFCLKKKKQTIQINKKKQSNNNKTMTIAQK